MSEGWSFETKQIHAGAQPDPATGARATPIYQTTSYVFRDTEHAANLFAPRRARQHLHPDHEPDPGRRSSSASPRSKAASRRCALSSGQAAETVAILNLAQAGDHIVSSPSLYGGTYNLFQLHAAEARHRGHLRRGPRRPRRVAGGGPAEHQGVLRRDHRQPAEQRPRHPRRRRRRARGRRAADRRQHDRRPRT